MERKKVIVVGAGFAGINAVKRLRKNKNVDITLIDRRNYHLFQPLLYQVATAGLSPADIAAPIRAVLRNNTNTEVLLEEVTGIDPIGKQVLMKGKTLSYDILVIATGARYHYFDHP